MWDLSWWDSGTDQDKRTEAARSVVKCVVDELQSGLPMCGEIWRAKRFVVRLRSEEERESFAEFVVLCWQRAGLGKDRAWMDGWIGKDVLRLEVAS